jgi:superfamily II DNA or RNA helicase
MDIIALYHKYIYDRYHSLLKSGKEEFDNKDLSKIFEYYSAIKLSEQYGQLFYEYNDIDPNFKELNQMSKHDSGVDLCNLVDTIVQCKLRKQNLNWGECSTFFASQNIFNDETNSIEIRWPKLIIARNSDCKLSCNLSIKNKLYTDITYSKEELLEFCSSLLLEEIETKEKCIIPKEEIILRDYQIECIELIKNSNKNVIIQLPTGCGKNVIITNYIIQRLYSKCNSENTKPLKFLILVPRIILMEQIRDEFVGFNLPYILDSIQIIGDCNTEFNKDKLITICVYNSIDKIDNFAQFEKIFIDEAHHIIKPEIYYNEEDTNSEYNSDLNSEYSEYDLDSEYSADDNLSDDDLDEDDEKEECNLDEIKEISKEENYLSKIRKLKKYNNNVFLSATIDQIDEYLYYSKDIRDMINEKYLCNYNIHIPIFSGSIDMIKSDTNVCKHLIQNYSNIIIYCNTKKEGIEINKIMNELLPLCSEYIDCDTKRNDRNTILEKFKSGEIPFLVNVKILVEGFNAPITKGVCFLHMPSSKTAIIQIIGRALRLHDYKTIANIILPFSNTEDEKSINDFLRILANNDHRIKQSYDNKKLGGYISLNKVGSNCSESDVSSSIESDCEFRFNMIYTNIGKLVNSEEIWMQKLEDVKAYIDEFKHRPSQRGRYKILGKWINTQISRNAKYKIAIMQNEKIYNLWIDFISNEKYKIYFQTNELKWINKLKDVELYLDTNNKRPSHRNTNKYDLHIALWINNTMYHYKHKSQMMKNKKIYKIWTDFINNEKYKKFFITKNEINDFNKWECNLKKLENYIKENKKLPIPKDINKDIAYLGEWVSTQKKLYKNKTQIMKNKEIYKIWTNFIECKDYQKYFIREIEKWYYNLEQIKIYINQNNRTPSVKNVNKNIAYLGNWLSSQKLKRAQLIQKNENIKNAWCEFINDKKYNKYFR